MEEGEKDLILTHIYTALLFDASHFNAFRPHYFLFNTFAYYCIPAIQILTNQKVPTNKKGSNGILKGKGQRA